MQAGQFVEHGEEGREGFAGAGGRRDEHILPAADARPRGALGRRRLSVAPLEPVEHERAFAGGGHGVLIRRSLFSRP
jgi:hypothetical protein